ncbi:peptide/nickel transport system permease protein [Paenochrobactrum gallinarii]|uniref:Peptide/nickel transport system permease protein n=1 Tax=Paenochrobactrum gallinarii TaxID=643673 RepID=A0A841M3V2_9HYPH|nr:ABC transporter permease [Paenochrobactrum gallinarii]MBB6262449.1 peptide/nickel transport system permease protein [Paenochrobactrum gallinarii]
MTIIDTITPSRRGLWQSPFIKRFLQHRLAAFGFATILFMALACALGPLLLPYSDTFIDIKQRFSAPFSGAHILGTDQMGRDILARLLMAGRISLSIGFAAMLVSMVIGICVGLIAGFYGGVIGAVLMRIVDAMLCFPSIFLLLAISAMISPSIPSIILLIAFTSWMEVARVVEAQTRSLRNRDYVMAAHSYGALNKRIMLREILPNAIAPIVVAATLNVAHAILAESYISFLGFGIQPPTPSWGNMLNSAQSYLTSAPWLAIIPGLAITLAVTSFNFLGDGLRDALDPKINT